MYPEKMYSPELSSLNRMCPQMKIKILFLLIIFAGIILISGCVDKEAQPTNYAASGDLYITQLASSIFYPYVGLLHSEGPGMHPQDLFPEGPHPEDSEPVKGLDDATYMLDNNIEKAERISIRLEEVIKSLKGQEEDVSRLEALLEEYKLHLEEAKKYRALANESTEEESNTEYSPSDKEMEYLKESQKSMMQANHILKEIFDEFQSMTLGSEELNNTSQLYASGEGKGLFAGSFDLNIHLENGVIAIPEISPDSEIDIKGNYTFEEKNTETQNSLRIYNIESADVKISGSHKTVMLGGTNITVTADGEGYVTLLGNGTYSVEEGETVTKDKKWGTPLPVFEEGRGPDKMEFDEKDHEVVGGHKKRHHPFEEGESDPEPEDKRGFIEENP